MYKRVLLARVADAADVAVLLGAKGEDRNDEGDDNNAPVIAVGQDFLECHVPSSKLGERSHTVDGMTKMTYSTISTHTIINTTDNNQNLGDCVATVYVGG